MKTKVDPTEDANGGAKQTFNAADLQRIAATARSIIAKQDKIADLEQLLKDEKEALEVLQLEELPGLMDAVGMSEFKLSGGEQITIKPIIRASLPSKGAIEKEKDAERKAELQDRLKRGLAYLQANGASALVKWTLDAKLGKDAKALAEKAIAALKKLKIEASAEEAVHPQTLGAWVKERLEGGKDIDHELFKIFTGKMADISRPKASKPSSAAGSSVAKHARGPRSLF